MSHSAGLFFCSFGFPDHLTGYVKISDGYLNVRSIPSLKHSKVVGRAYENEGVWATDIFVEKERDWYYVNTDGDIKGWISGKWVNLW